MSGRYVVYLALGTSRIKAAARHTARLAAGGARVLLVITDLPEWADAGTPPGVAVHRLGAAERRDAMRAARRLLLRGESPLRDADLLVAGDPEALAVAWAVRRRYPELPVHFEPSDDLARRAGPADLAVLTPWYPSPNNPLAGAFVKATIGAVEDHFDRISILHTEDWAFDRDSMTGRVIEVAARRQTAQANNIAVEDQPEGELTRVAVPTGFPIDYATRAADHVRLARAALPTGRIEAPLVHAHTGIYGGVVAIRLARKDARIVVTEHSSFLNKVLGQSAARELYREVLERVDVLACVSQSLHDILSDRFPRYAGKLRVIPNAIDFDDFVVRPEPPADLLRWLYVGRMARAKGVLTLVDGFARIAPEEPRATLTLVGSGPLDETLRARVNELGLADRITLHPAVPPEEVVGLMHRHDLLVHASTFETFGMTVVEAVATGMPVLVARSSGPAETLAGLEDKAGLLIDVSEDPEVIAEGYRKLRARFDTLDPAGARAALLARYSSEAVSAQLRDLYAARVEPAVAAVAPAAPARTAAPAAAPAERVLVVAIGPRSAWRTRDLMHDALSQGLGVDLITADTGLWKRAALDDRVKVYGVGDAEGRRPIRRVEQLMVYRGPGKLFSVARKAARKLHSAVPEAAISTVQLSQQRVSRAFHNKIYQRGHNVVRPRLMWRIARRQVLPDLDLSQTRRVIVSGTGGMAIGWHLARKHPHLSVTTSLEI